MSAQFADSVAPGVEAVIAIYGCVPSCDDMTKVRWIMRYVSQLPDPLRRKVIAKLSADYINDGTHIDGNVRS